MENKLEPTTRYERELIDNLQEELAELVAIASKVKRFGVDSDNRGKMDYTNKHLLTMEMADVQVMLDLVKRYYEIEATYLANCMDIKVDSLRRYSSLYPVLTRSGEVGREK